MALIVDFPQQLTLPIKGNPPRVLVSFEGYATVKYIENLSLKYKADLWFSSAELETFKIKATKMLRSISSSGMSIAQYAQMNVNDTSTFMGLENYLTSNTSQNIRDRRGAIWRAVRLEQARQLDTGIHDPETMAAIAEAMSEKSRKRARIIGLVHAPDF